MRIYFDNITINIFFSSIDWKPYFLETLRMFVLWKGERERERNEIVSLLFSLIESKIIRHEDAKHKIGHSFKLHYRVAGNL